jgi:hypothetical protein
MPRKRTYRRSPTLQRGGNAWDTIRSNHLISGGIGAGLGFLGPVGKIAGIGLGLAGRQWGFGQSGGARPRARTMRPTVMPSGVRF